MAKLLTQGRERVFTLRILLVILGLAAFIATLFYGSTVPVSVQDARNITQEVNSSLPRSPTVWNLTPVIFENNFRIALFGLIPFLFGAGILLFIGYNTGIAFSAQALVSSSPTPVTGPELVLITMIFPYTFWELSGYALTLMEGIVITRGLIKGNRFERFIAPGHFRDGELFKALLITVLTAIVLLLAALMESYIIVLFRKV